MHFLTNFLEFQTWLHKDILLVLPYFSLVLEFLVFIRAVSIMGTVDWGPISLAEPNNRQHLILLAENVAYMIPRQYLQMD